MSDTTTRFAILEPSADRHDAADVPLYIRAVAAALESLGTIYGQGTLAGRPVSSGGSPGKQGRIYYATDNGHLYYDFGTGWSDIGPASAVPADGSITGGAAGAGVKIAARTITKDNIVLATLTAAEIANNVIDALHLVDAIVPSRGASAATEALRALGSAAGTAAAGNDARLSDTRMPKTPDVCVNVAGPLGNAATYTITAPVAGTYILAWGAGIVNPVTSGNLTITPNVPGGIVANLGGSGGGAAGPMHYGGLVLTAGQVITLTVGAASSGTLQNLWARLTRTA